MNSSRCTDSIENFELNGATLVRPRPVYVVPIEFYKVILLHISSFIYTVRVLSACPQASKYCVWRPEIRSLFTKGEGFSLFTRIYLGPGRSAVGNLAICTQISRFYFCC